MSEEAEVLFSVQGKVGLITLNRPKALNALTLPMVRALEPKLREWAADPAIAAVVIEGAGERAFCAGGDVAAIYRARQAGDDTLGRDFFREEYVVNRAIFRFPKPWIALLDGITMGGGVGLSVHGPFRVATERFLFAMPETAIGLFPDVGGGHFLPRLPGQLGMYLAMTGERLKAADALHAGVLTHHVPSERIGALKEALAGADWGGDANAVAKRVLDGFHVDPGQAQLPARRAEIDRHFAGASCEEIVASLEKDGSEWAAATLKTLRRLSPTSMKITFRQIRDGARMEFEDIMTMEYRMSQGCMRGGDFYEGVRSVLIDKDHAPKWDPATLEAVDQARVDAHFAPVANDLLFK